MRTVWLGEYMNLREEMNGDREYCVVKILVTVTHSQTSFGRSVERYDLSALRFLLLCGFLWRT